MAKQTTQKAESEDKTSSHDYLPSTRGRTFQGFVIKKFPKRVVVEFERTVYIEKYERFYRKKTKLHARLPDAMENDINVGDYIEIKETRPLSKIIHFIVTKRVKSAEQIKGGKQ